MALPNIGSGGGSGHSISSMRGWILNAPTCAPVSPRRQARDDVGKLFVGNTDAWGSTSGADFLGVQSPRRRPILPSPRHNLLGDDVNSKEQFQCTSRNMHQNPGRSQRVVRKIYSNAPSEVDHPMFGIHDPFRKERLGPNPTGTSMYQDVYIAPEKSTYSYSSAEPPYPDDRDKFNFNKKDTMGSHLSEQQSRYQWPAWTVPLKPVRHKNELAIE